MTGRSPLNVPARTLAVQPATLLAVLLAIALCSTARAQQADVFGPRPPAPIYSTAHSTAHSTAQPATQPPALAATQTAAQTDPLTARARPVPVPASARNAATPADQAGAGTGQVGAAQAPSTGLLDGGVARTALALAGVIGLIVLCAAVVRYGAKANGGITASFSAAGRAPSGVLEVLGRYPISRSQSLVLLRIDRRVLLLSRTQGRGGGSMSTLAEFDHPDDVESLLVKTRSDAAESMQATFHEAIEEASARPDAGWPDEVRRAAQNERARAFSARRVDVGDEGDTVELLNPDADPLQTDAQSGTPSDPAEPENGFQPAAWVSADARRTDEPRRQETRRAANSAEAADPVRALRERLDALRKGDFAVEAVA